MSDWKAALEAVKTDYKEFKEDKVTFDKKVSDLKD